MFKRRLQSAGIEFKFQPIVGFYIPDFVFPDRMLIIELDGPSHDTTQQYDTTRDAFLRRCGFDILRIKNEAMRSFDVALIPQYPLRPIEDFRGALARANAYKGHAKKKRGASRKKRMEARQPDVRKPVGILDRLFHERYLANLKAG